MRGNEGIVGEEAGVDRGEGLKEERGGVEGAHSIPLSHTQIAI